MATPIFDNPWYAEMIERFGYDEKQFTPDEGPNALACLGRMMLASSCIIAQAIDGLADKVGKLAGATEVGPNDHQVGLSKTLDHLGLGDDVVVAMALDGVAEAIRTAGGR